MPGERDGASARPPESGIAAPVVYTVGHSTRSSEEFIGLLQAHGIEHLVDVRTIPKSRHNPQFGREALAAALLQAGIRYTHMPGLGGLRRAAPGSPNSGWRNASFRGYADYMQTAPFQQSLAACIALAGAERIALMCAEAVPWRCHRSLIADALTVRGIAACEIASRERARRHVLTRWAVVNGTDLTYPAAAAD